MPETARPFTAFRFTVEISVSGVSNEICQASFSECDGLEMTMQPQTIREGGNNNQPIHFVGPVTYGQLSLKRGMTANFDLWKWFEAVLRSGQNGLRANAVVNMMRSDGQGVQASFALTKCLPVKLKVPSLNAREGLIAIEEMQIAYERLSVNAA